MFLFSSDKAENDRITSEAEMKELDRQISHDRKLRQFMKLKAQERHEDEQLLLYRKRKGFFSVELALRMKAQFFSRIQKTKPLKNVEKNAKNIQSKLMKQNSSLFKKLVAFRVSRNWSENLSKVFVLLDENHFQLCQNIFFHGKF